MFSPNAYNSLGVGTTQLYNEQVVYNRKRHGKFKLGNRTFCFRVKPYFPKDLSKEFLLVDLVNNISRLAEDQNAVLGRVSHVFACMRASVLRKEVGFMVVLEPRSSLHRSIESRHTPQFDQPVPTDDQSGLSLLKVYKGEEGIETPMLASGIQEKIEQLIQERLQKDLLASLGLQPTKSAIFVGKPGVGKTVTARWLAAQLQVPL